MSQLKEQLHHNTKLNHILMQHTAHGGRQERRNHFRNDHNFSAQALFNFSPQLFQPCFFVHSDRTFRLVERLGTNMEQSLSSIELRGGSVTNFQKTSYLSLTWEKQYCLEPNNSTFLSLALSQWAGAGPKTFLFQINLALLLPQNALNQDKKGHCLPLSLTRRQTV